jgi:hypothetical protein
VVDLLVGADGHDRPRRQVHGLQSRLVQRQPDDDRIGQQDHDEPQQPGEQRLGAQLVRVQQRRDVGQQAIAEPAAARVQRREHRPVVAGAHGARPAAGLGRAGDRDEVLAQAGAGQRGGDDLGHRRDAHVAHGTAHLGGEVAVVDRHDQPHARPDPLDDEREAQRHAVVARDHDDGVDVGRQRAPDVAVVGGAQVDDVRGGVVEHAPHDVDEAPLAEDEDALLRRVVICVDVSHRVASMREAAKRRGAVCHAERWADCFG